MDIAKLLSSDAYIPVNKHLAKTIGLLETVLLCELIRQRERFGGGEFSISQSELIEQTSLSEFQIREGTKKLMKLGLIEVIKKGLPCKYFYKINEPLVLQLFDHQWSRNGTTGGLETEPHIEVIKKVIKKDIRKSKKVLQNSTNFEELQEQKNSLSEQSFLASQELEIPPSSARPPTRREDIDELIEKLHKVCDEVGVAYDKKMDREFARHILTAKEFSTFCERIGQTAVEFSINVLKASIKIGYFKGPCAGPMMIYQNYANVYNQTLAKKQKQTSNIIYSPVL